MELQLATTLDILNELRRRDVHFVYAGFQHTNHSSNSICFACQGHSRREMLDLVQLLQQRIESKTDVDVDSDE